MIYSGLGSPENVVTAIPSALYLQVDGVVGAQLWQKHTGIAETGWELFEASTVPAHAATHAAGGSDPITGDFVILNAENTGYVHLTGELQLKGGYNPTLLLYATTPNKFALLEVAGSPSNFQITHGGVLRMVMAEAGGVAFPTAVSVTSAAPQLTVASNATNNTEKRLTLVTRHYQSDTHPYMGVLSAVSGNGTGTVYLGTGLDDGEGIGPLQISLYVSPTTTAVAVESLRLSGTLGALFLLNNTALGSSGSRVSMGYFTALNISGTLTLGTVIQTPTYSGDSSVAHSQTPYVTFTADTQRANANNASGNITLSGHTGCSYYGWEYISPAIGGGGTLLNEYAFYVGQMFATNKYGLYTYDSHIRCGGNLISAGRTMLADGYAGAPALAFTSDPDSGFFLSGDSLVFAVGGVAKLLVNGVANQITASGCTVSATEGTVSAPGFSFGGLGSNGMYADVGTYDLGFARLGVQKLLLKSTEAEFGTVSAAIGLKVWGSYVELNNAASLFVPVSNTIGLKIGSAEKLRVDTDATAGFTALLVYDVNAAALARVKVGANNTGPGGSGRALYLDNTA
jgi:hypothetical protein